jgi:hypothetical protein
MTDFVDLARAHLPADTADRLLALLRPTIQLSIAQDGQPVVGQLGGAADLPEGVSWPVGPSSRPQWLVATLDCARPAAYEVDIELPGDGTLLFFVQFGGDGDAVIYMPAGTPTRRQSEGWAHPKELLTAQTVLTWPHTPRESRPSLVPCLRARQGSAPAPECPARFAGPPA